MRRLVQFTFVGAILALGGCDDEKASSNGMTSTTGGGQADGAGQATNTMSGHLAGTPSGAGETASAGQANAPQGGDAPSAGQANPPAGGDMAAAGQANPPVGGEMPPAGGESPPAGGQIQPPQGGMALIPMGGMIMGGQMGQNDRLWTTEEVFEAMEPGCGACHGEGQSLPYFASLNDFQTRLVDDAEWIIAGQPIQSVFLSLLDGNGPGVFAQMPPGPQSYFEQAANDQDLPNRNDLERWIASLVDVAPPPPPAPPACWDHPAPKALHRLNSTEYNHAVQYLTGTDRTPADDFPSDDSSYGFDHIADTLSVSPLLVEKYDIAAGELAEEVIPDHVGSPRIYLSEAENMMSQTGRAFGSYWNLWSNGTLSGEIEVAVGGRYRFRARVGGGQAGPDPVQFQLSLNGQTYGPFETVAQNPNYSVVQLPDEVQLEAGLQFIGIRFINDYYVCVERDEEGECLRRDDRNLHVDSLELEGPFGTNDDPTAFEERFFEGCNVDDGDAGEACFRRGLERFGRIVYRRPMTQDESDRLWTLVIQERNEPGGLRMGVRQAVHALLLSPNFLFKVELSGAEGAPLNGYERATRLASFLWRSVPDESTLDRARLGDLDDPAGMAQQARRMLATPRAAAMYQDLADQWLMVRQVEVIDPEYANFPNFDEPLRAAMIEEMRRVFGTLWVEDRSLLDLVDADFTYVNGRLAQHYGFDGIAGDEFQRVQLPRGNRLGLLTQAGWLSATSERTRTSPVKRGKWVLEQLLCSEPPPPPPDVDGLPEEVDQDASLRERLEQHRADPNCAACHTNMDAIGFGLEQFDAIGAYREMDKDEVIEPAGTLLGEVDFDDAIGMARAVRAHERLGPCVTQKLITYALGRGVEEGEHCLKTSIQEAASNHNFTARALVEAIVQSPIFTHRGAPAPEGDGAEEGQQ